MIDSLIHIHICENQLTKQASGTTHTHTLTRTHLHIHLHTRTYRTRALTLFWHTRILTHAHLHAHTYRATEHECDITMSDSLVRAYLYDLHTLQTASVTLQWVTRWLEVAPDSPKYSHPLMSMGGPLGPPMDKATFSKAKQSKRRQSKAAQP